MKLVTFIRPGAAAPEVGLLREDGVRPVSDWGLPYTGMSELIDRISAEERRRLNEEPGGEPLPLESLRLLSPIPEPKQDVICLGLNYSDHAREASGFSDAFALDKSAPVFFSKRVNYAPGDGEGVSAHADVTEQLDYEVELAVIIGRDAKNVTPETVQDYIFGYTVLNDMTAREIQTRHKQWYFGKSLDGLNPMGPCIVTADEIPYPPALRIRSSVNGEPRQDACTDMLLHDITEILCTLTRGMTLKAGTIIATGTPKGVAMGMEKPQFLKAGDLVCCEIEGIGTLRTPIL